MKSLGGSSAKLNMTLSDFTVVQDSKVIAQAQPFIVRSVHTCHGDYESIAAALTRKLHIHICKDPYVKIIKRYLNDTENLAEAIE